MSIKVNWSRYNNLGFNSPYSSSKDNEHKFSYRFNELLEDHKELDLIAITQMTNFGYMLGDRTLLRGVNKSPFLAKYNSDIKEFEYDRIIMKGEILKKEDIVNHLYSLLQAEMIKYIGESKNIGVLLSGGMDSRIVLGILNSLIVEERVSGNININLYTWGLPNSRDVVYAKLLASKFKMNLKHFTVNEEDICDNIQYVLKNGLEFNPIHLHAMLKVADVKNVDCILAGSFGDSIGRAQFSGSKVWFLTSHKERLKNKGYFINKKLYIKANKKSEYDIDKYSNLFLQDYEYQNIELEYQIHYMRRMLNPAMMSIQKKIPLYQMFSSPEVYKFIWSLDYKVRNYDIYKSLFELFYIDLLDIPYAKTGLPYNFYEGTPDNYLKDHHKYKQQITLFFKDYIEKKLVKSDFFDLGIVNKNVVMIAFNGLKFFKNKTNLFYEDKLLWLAMLSDFIQSNDIVVQRNRNNYDVKGATMYLYHKIKND